MPTVTIKIEDRLKDGVEGVRVSVESDPDFPGNHDDETNAQRMALDILDMILDGCEDVQEVDVGNDPDPTLN